ncbi:MAG: GTPase [Pirellulaceae bacterium]
MPETTTLASLLTPPGRAAIATVAVRGPDAMAACEAYFRGVRGRPLTDSSPGSILVGHWHSAANQKPSQAGEELVLGHIAPDHWEIHCHGGPQASGHILANLSAAGCQVISWRDWALRFEGSPVAAEARILLAKAATSRVAGHLLDQYQGALERELRRILELLSVDRMDAARGAIAALLRWSEFGLRLTQPWRVVLAGEPNVGKSSLINALLGYDRAIVFDQPGTTRDLLTATTALEGWPVELTDTAGLRDSTDRLESSGIERAARMIAEADCVVHVMDVTRIGQQDETTATWQTLLAESPRRVGVLNKVDLLPTSLTEAEPELIHTSVTTGQGLDRLQSAIATRLVPEVPSAGTPLPFTAAQEEHLAAAHRADTVDQISAYLRALLG